MQASTLEVAVVTGGNRGIGREVSKQLARHGFHVVLAARDPARGEAVARELAAETGGSVEALTLDVADPDSARHFAAALAQRHPGGVDVLVNNAGVALRGFNSEVAERTLEVNYFGLLRVTEAVLPQLRPGGRVVLLSSGQGDRELLSSRRRAELSLPDLDREHLSALMRRFIDTVKAGRHENDGWPSSAYGVSKIGVNALAGVLARELADDPRQLRINAVCPGWVRTDMGGPQADRAVEQGAASVLWGVALGPEGPTGGFFRDGRPAHW